MVRRHSVVDRVNALPKWARNYIAAIETEDDPAGTQRRLIEQEELIRQLTAKIAELKGVRFRKSDLKIDGRGPGVRPLKK